MRFLEVTLDTYQDTSGYMYLGLLITIHQDTPRYRITIHVSWTRHDDTSRYNQDTSRYMYLGRFVRAALDTHKIRSRYTSDTCRIRILGSFYLPCCPRSSRRSASSSLRVGRHVCGARWRAAQLSGHPCPPLRATWAPWQLPCLPWLASIGQYLSILAENVGLRDSARWEGAVACVEACERGVSGQCGITKCRRRPPLILA